MSFLPLNAVSIRRVLRRTVWVVLMGVAVGLSAAGTRLSIADDLPDFGSASSRGMTYSDERRLGEAILMELRAKLPQVTDIELNNYLISLGSQLSTVPMAAHLKFHFLLSDNKQINAFATPGGIIAINSGLFSVVENESQLVAVLAHEITHVDRRHLPRLMALSKDINWLSAVTSVLSVVAAVYNPAIGAVGSRIGTSIPIERQLSYSRAFEREADKFGMKLMVKSGFDPRGMPEFLRHLSRLGNNSQIPEFLLTHPMTDDRVSEAANLAGRYRGEYRTDSRQFRYAHARLVALLNPRDTLALSADTPLELYRRSVAMTESGNAAGAANILRGLRRSQPGMLPVELAYMQAMLALGDARETLEAGESMRRLYPNHEALTYYMAKALVMSGEPQRALDALGELTGYKKANSPLVAQLMAEAASMMNVPWLENEFLGDYYAETGRLRAAIEQYRLSALHKKGRHISEARVTAKKKRLEELLERLQ